MRKTMFALIVIVAMVFVPSALANGGKNDHGKNKGKDAPKPYKTKCLVKIGPSAYKIITVNSWRCPKPDVPKPPTTTPDPQPDPPVVQANRTGYCFQTSNRGWSYVNLEAGDVIEPGFLWFDLYVAKATVTVSGQTLVFAGWEDWRTDGGIVEAPFVEGVGQTCDNPHVK